MGKLRLKDAVKRKQAATNDLSVSVSSAPSVQVSLSGVDDVDEIQPTSPRLQAIQQSHISLGPSSPVASIVRGTSFVCDTVHSFLSRRRSSVALVDELHKDEINHLREKIRSLEEDLADKILVHEQDKKLLRHKDAALAQALSKGHVETRKAKTKQAEQQLRIINTQQEGKRLTMQVVAKDRQLQKQGEQIEFKARTLTVKHLRSLRDVLKAGGDSRAILEAIHKAECGEMQEVAKAGAAFEEEGAGDDMELAMFELKQKYEFKVEELTDITMKLQFSESRVETLNLQLEQMVKEAATAIPLRDILSLKSKISELAIDKRAILSQISGFLYESVLQDFYEVLYEALEKRDGEVNQRFEYLLAEAQATIVRLKGETRYNTVILQRFRKTTAAGVDAFTSFVPPRYHSKIAPEYSDESDDDDDDNGTPIIENIEDQEMRTAVASGICALQKMFADLEGAAEKLLVQEGEMLLLRSTLDAREVEWREAIEELAVEKEKNAERKRDFAKMTAELKESRANLAVLHNTLLEKETEITEQSSEISSLTTALKELKWEASNQVSLSAEIDVLNTKLDESRALATSLREQKVSLLMRLNVSEEKLLAVKGDLRCLQSEQLTKEEEAQAAAEAEAAFLRQPDAVATKAITDLESIISVLLEADAHDMLASFLHTLLGIVMTTGGKIGLRMGRASVEEVDSAVQCDLLIPVTRDESLTVLLCLAAAVASKTHTQPVINQQWRQRFEELRGTNQAELVKLSKLLKVEYESAQATRNASLSVTSHAKLNILRNLLHAEDTTSNVIHIGSTQDMKAGRGLPYQLSTPPTVISGSESTTFQIQSRRALPNTVAKRRKGKKVKRDGEAEGEGVCATPSMAGWQEAIQSCSSLPPTADYVRRNLAATVPPIEHSRAATSLASPRSVLSATSPPYTPIPSPSHNGIPALTSLPAHLNTPRTLPAPIVTANFSLSEAITCVPYYIDDSGKVVDNGCTARPKQTGVNVVTVASDIKEKKEVPRQVVSGGLGGQQGGSVRAGHLLSVEAAPILGRKHRVYERSPLEGVTMSLQQRGRLPEV